MSNLYQATKKLDEKEVQEEQDQGEAIFNAPAAPAAAPPSVSKDNNDEQNKNADHNKLLLATGRPSAEAPTPSSSLQPKEKLALAPPTRPPERSNNLGDSTADALSNREKASSKMLGIAPALPLTADVGDAHALNKDEAENEDISPSAATSVPRDRSVIADDDESNNGHAFQAVLADEEQQSKARNLMLDDAVVASDVQVVKKRKVAFLVIGVVVAIAIGVGVALGVTLGGGNDDGPSVPTGMPSLAPTDAPTMSPTIAPSSTPTSSQFSEVARLIESTFGYVVEDSTSPQYRAAQWMAEVDELFDYSVGVDPDRFAQRYSLAVLYYSTGGDTTWKRQANFLSPSEHECDWQAPAPASTPALTGLDGVVQCAVTQFGSRLVTWIEMIDNGLSGSLPDEIGSLSGLEALGLSINQLQGTIPASLFSLPDFVSLQLPFNDLSGSLPTEIGLATALFQLWIERSSMTGTIPSEIGLTDMVAMTLAENLFSGAIPSEVSRLSGMRLFNINGNAFEGGFPFPPSAMQALEQLTLSYNRFEGELPVDLGTMPLQSMSITNNSFSGPIPESIQQLDEMVLLAIDRNKLSGMIPSDWNNMSSTLRLFSLSTNQLEGAIPESFGNLTSLELFDISANLLTGTLPEGLGDAPLLQYVLFQENDFTGTIPATYGQIEPLTAATFTLTRLSGDMSFFCNGNETLRPMLRTLHADCLGEVICPCCHLCCDQQDNCEFQ